MPSVAPSSSLLFSQPLWRRTAPVAAALGAALLLAACGKSDAPAAAPAAPPPPEVGVVTVTQGAIGLVTELPGRTEASRVAQVRARVAGILQKRLFKEGSDVKAGQPLYQIDDAPYRATLASAQASLARAEANVTQAKAQADRSQPLFEAKAISQQELFTAVAAGKQADADVAVAKAAVTTAQINVGYGAVKSPISGRIGRTLVTEGALVGQGETTPLAVVQQIDPMYVNFTQPVAEVLRLRAAIATGKLKNAAGPDAAAVRLVLDDGSVYPIAGKLLFSDLTVDPASGQIALRAEVPNPKGVLLPGMYVRGRLELAQASNALVLPQQAVQRGSNGDTVLVVAPDGKFAPRPVKLGAAQGGNWIVLEGLQAGEQVVADGFQKLQGAKAVKAVPWTPPGAASGATSGAASAAAPAPAASR